VLLSILSTGTSVESKTESAHINLASRIKVTLNRESGFLPTSKILCIYVASMLGSVVIFWSLLYRLLEFAENSEFSYIPLIPAISAFLIWMRRRPIFRQSKFSPAAGAVILAVGILLSSLESLLPGTILSDRLWVPTLGIVTIWCGLFVFCYGLQSARAAMLPLCLLFFMIPEPSVTNAVIRFLQHGSAVLSASLFRMIGVPAVRDGMVISLPRLTIEVAPQCSGIRSSISLLILTLAGANLYLRSGWNKTLLVCLLAPLCILRNAIRIVTLSTLAIYVDPTFLTGPLHHKGGVLFFFLATAILMCVFLLMQRSERRNLVVGCSLFPKDSRESRITGDPAASTSSHHRSTHPGTRNAFRPNPMALQYLRTINNRLRELFHRP
jgi:exosortase